MPASVHRDAAWQTSWSIPAFGAASAIGATLVTLHGYSIGSAPDERWLLAARYTARLSFPIFLLAFVASSWNQLAPSRVSRFLVRRRRALGLAFAIAHTVHLAALLTYNAVAGKRPDVVALLVGGGAYLVMFAMVATSNDAAVRWLGRNWLRLHRFGVYWLWFVFTASYGGRSFGGQPEFAPLFGLALAALALRIAASRARRSRRADATSPAAAGG
jgi:DMSO/TMAO reductase YedYZ heme-binding membrane subunit